MANPFDQFDAPPVAAPAPDFSNVAGNAVTAPRAAAPNPFDAFDAAPAPQEVGALESASRGLQTGLHTITKNVLGGGLGGLGWIGDAIHSALTGDTHTELQDAAFGHIMAPEDAQIAQLAIDPATERQSFGAKAAGTVAHMLPDLALMLLTRGEAGAPELAQGGGTLARTVEDALSHSATASALPGVVAGGERAQAHHDTGIGQAALDVLSGYGQTALQNTLPLAAPVRAGASLPEAIATRAAAGAAAMPAGSGTAALLQGQDYGGEQAALDALTGAVTAQLGATRERSPDLRSERERVAADLERARREAAPEPAPTPADATPRQGEPPAPAGTTPAPEPAVPQRTPFAQPNDHARDDFVRRAGERGVAPEVARDLAPAAPTDRTTGFVDGRQGVLDTTVERAQQHVADTGEPAVYVGGDIANLGGLNKHFGSKQSDADVHYRAMAEILHDELKGTGGDVVPLRTGGDEIGAVVVNVDRGTAQAAVDRARSRIQEYARQNGLDTIPHKEAGRDPGVGMHFGVADIAPGVRVKDILDEADNGIDISRAGGSTNVAEGTVEAPRDGASGGRPAGDQGGSDAPVAGVPREAGAGQHAAGERGSDPVERGSDPLTEVSRLQQDVAAARAAGDHARVADLTPQLTAAQDRASAPQGEPGFAPVEDRPTATLHVTPKGEASPAPTEPPRTPEAPAQAASEGLPPTGTKHAVTDAERAAEGRPAREPHTPRTNEEALADARTDLEQNPARGREVVEKLRNGGTDGVSAHEEAVLMAHKVATRAKRDAAAKRATDESLSPEERAVARREYDEANAEVIAIDEAAANSGREWGRMGQLRQRLIRDDFSFEAMERKARIARDRPLTPEEQATVRAQADKIEALQKQLDEAAAREVFAEQQRQIVREGRKAAAGKRHTRSERLQRMEQRAAEARARLRAKLGTAHSGVDPGMFADAATVGAYHLMRGVTAAAEWARAVRADLGDKLFARLEPRLDELRKAAETLVAKERLSVDTILEKIDPDNITARDINALVRANILDGAHSYDDVMDAVHDDLKQIAPTITQEQVREIYAEPAPKKSPAPGSPEAGVVRRTAQAKDKTEKREFDRVKRPDRVVSKVQEKLEFELSKAKAEFARQQFEAEMAQRPAWRKVLGGVQETFNLARALMTSLDLSAVLRQGGFIALGHPVRAAKAFGPMLRAFASAQGEHAANAEIAARPNARLYKKFGLELTDAHNHSLSKMEEAFMSRLVDKLPKALGGGLVRGSNRAYTTFLNRLRADSFDAMAATLARGKELTPEEGKAIASYVNIATGRGNIGLNNRAAVGLNTVFFAPRLVASRFQLLAGTPMYGGSARTRTLIAGEYARMLTGMAVVYGLASLASDGDDGIVTFDPRSTDFGRIKFGNTYIDPLMGLAQVSVLVAREVTGEKVTASGKLSPLRDSYRLGDLTGDAASYPKSTFGGDNAASIIGRFMRTKLAPVPGAAVDLLNGSDVVGNKVTPVDVGEKLVTPMSLQDINKIMQENGVPQGTAIEMLNLLGMGVQYREPREHKASRKGNGITYQ